MSFSKVVEVRSNCVRGQFFIFETAAVCQKNKILQSTCKCYLKLFKISLSFQLMRIFYQGHRVMNRGNIRVPQAYKLRHSLCTSSPKIIHESEDWFVVDKPPGWHSCELVNKLSSHQRIVETWLRTNQVDSIESLRRTTGTYFSKVTQPRQNELPQAGMVNRLDEPTSG